MYASTATLATHEGHLEARRGTRSCIQTLRDPRLRTHVNTLLGALQRGEHAENQRMAVLRPERGQAVQLNGDLDEPAMPIAATSSPHEA